mgnify:CR=1 FL=1
MPHPHLTRDEAISIHALREEGDPQFFTAWITTMHFYPRPPRGGRPGYAAADLPCAGISIHALREEGDHPRVFHRTAASKFLSTPSARRATKSNPMPPPRRGISIHALREEGDPLFIKVCDKIN